MSPDVLKAALDNISAHEGRRRSMYLDTNGFVTCGVGHLIAKCDDATALDWYRADRPANRGEIISDWSDVKYCKRKNGNLYLPEEEIDRILTFDIDQFVSQLESVFPQLETYPSGVQVALLDIAFNTGSVTKSKWPRLVQNVVNHDWVNAAKESYRPAVSVTRNADTAAQLLA